MAYLPALSQSAFKKEVPDSWNRSYPMAFLEVMPENMNHEKNQNIAAHSSLDGLITTIPVIIANCLLHLLTVM
jgi:hypothetical protein